MIVFNKIDYPISTDIYNTNGIKEFCCNLEGRFRKFSAIPLELYDPKRKNSILGDVNKELSENAPTIWYEKVDGWCNYM